MALGSPRIGSVALELAEIGASTSRSWVREIGFVSREQIDSAFVSPK